MCVMLGCDNVTQNIMKSESLILKKNASQWCVVQIGRLCARFLGPLQHAMTSPDLIRTAPTSQQPQKEICVSNPLIPEVVTPHVFVRQSQQQRGRGSFPSLHGRHHHRLRPRGSVGSLAVAPVFVYVFTLFRDESVAAPR